VTEPVQTTAIAEGIRTDEWFAIGEVKHDPLPDAPLSDVSTASPRRRGFVRVIGCVIIIATIACVARLAAHAPVRKAILRWGSFGQSDRILALRNR
jgi:hypothetical protein